MQQQPLTFTTPTTILRSALEDYARSAVATLAVAELFGIACLLLKFQPDTVTASTLIRTVTIFLCSS